MYLLYTYAQYLWLEHLHNKTVDKSSTTSLAVFVNI